MKARMPKPKSARERREDARLLVNTENTTNLMLLLFAMALNKRRHFGEKHLAERKIHIEIDGRRKKK